MYKRFFIFVLLYFTTTIVFAHLGVSLCNGGGQIPMDTIPPTLDPNPTDSTIVPVYVLKGLYKTIGTMGYDDLGNTLQWVAATASLPYTSIPFDKTNCNQS
jgi:hypothetical protein